jgi:hypothetical protein
MKLLKNINDIHIKKNNRKNKGIKTGTETLELNQQE